MSRRTFAIIFTLGIILRVLWINVPPLWYDENFTLLLARSSFSAMLDATAGDVHPPLWYIVEWIIFHIAPNAAPWVIRVPALIFSVASLWMFEKVTAKLRISPQVQTAAFVMMAVMPFQLWYAQEGRMYAMLEFLVLWALYAALTVDRVSLFIAGVAMLYTQNYGVFYIAAIALVIVVHRTWDAMAFTKSMTDLGYPSGRVKRIAVNDFIGFVNGDIAPLFTAGAAWLPWMMTVTSQMSDIEGRYWIMDKSAGAVLIILYKLFLTAAVPSAFFFASYLVTFAAVILGVLSIIRSRHPARVTVAIMAFVPLLIAWIASAVWQPVLLFRPLIGISPFLYLTVAWVLEDKQHV